MVSIYGPAQRRLPRNGRPLASNWYARNLQIFRTSREASSPAIGPSSSSGPLLAQASAERVDGPGRPENQLERASNLIGVMRYLNTSQSVAPGCRYYRGRHSKGFHEPCVEAIGEAGARAETEPSLMSSPALQVWFAYRRVDYVYSSSILERWNYRLR